MDTRTVLFQPLNHIGLGHINRLAVIALALHDLDDGIRTPFVVEESSHALLDARALPYIPFPSSSCMSNGGAWSAWTTDERYSFQQKLSRAILQAAVPRVVVFDCLPIPAFAEAVMTSGIPIVFCLREMRILGDYLRTVRDLLDRAQLILIPHPQGTFAVPQDLAAKCRFVGEIARVGPVLSTRERDRDAPHILISGGGGGYPGTVEFYNLALKATAMLREHHAALKVQLITGPLFRDWRLLEPSDGIRVVPFEPDMTALFDDADLVICQAGYNTVAELAQLQTKTVLVPAEREWDDQFGRAERVTRRQQSFRVFRGKNPAVLADLAGEFLHLQIPRTAVARPGGAIHAAKLIHEIVTDKTAL
jgi:predicted glycosyltransferase